MSTYKQHVLLFLTIGFLATLIPPGSNLEYEYALFLNILGAMAAPLLILPAGLPQLKVGTILTGIWATVLPGMGLLATGSCPCGFREFFFWFLVGWLPTWCLLFGALQWLLRLRNRKGRWSALLTGYSLIMVWALLGAALMWFFPQKRMVHGLLGFIHGPIYDHYIPVDDAILGMRLQHACLGLGLWALRFSFRRNAIYLALLSFVFIETADFSWGQPTVLHGSAAIQSRLSTKLVDGNMELYYDATGTSKESAQRVFSEARFHYRQLAQKMALHQPYVAIYLYPDDRAKKLLFGGHRTDIADVVTPSIHIVADQFPHPSLRHELVHALAAYFGYHGLGFHPNMFLTEGLAVALAPNRRSKTPDMLAAEMFRRNPELDLTGLFSPLFWLAPANQSYATAGSLLAFVVANDDFTSVKKLYAGDSWEESFGEPVEDTMVAWRAFLAASYPDQREDLEAGRILRYRGLIYDQCPHNKALMGMANDDYWTTLRRPMERESAMDYWRYRAALPGNDTVATYWLHVQRSRETLSQEQLDSLLSDIRDQVKTLDSIEDVQSLLLVYDLLRSHRRASESDIVLLRLEKAARELRFGNSLLRHITIRKQLRGTDRELGWLEFLMGKRSVAKVWQGSTESPVHWVEWYLTGLNAPETWLKIRGRDASNSQPTPAEIAAEFDALAGLGAVKDSFEATLLWSLGRRYFQEKSFSLAHQAYGRLQSVDPANAQYYQQLQEMMVFLQESN